MFINSLKRFRINVIGDMVHQSILTIELLFTTQRVAPLPVLGLKVIQQILERSMCLVIGTEVTNELHELFDLGVALRLRYAGAEMVGQWVRSRRLEIMYFGLI